MRKQIQIETEAYDKLETRAQQLGLTVDQYVQMIFESLDQAKVAVSTIVARALNGSEKPCYLRKNHAS